MNEEAKPAKPSVRMSEDDAWAMLEQSLVGILTTLRRDGRPIALPIWYVVLDRRIYVTTRGKKVQRARHDARASFLVEAGERWADLRAVHVDCRAAVIEPPDELADRIRAAMDEKYRAYRTAASDMPSATRDHYRKAMGAVIELVPDGKLLTWDNRNLGIS
ncbi:MAG: pyridoxamine 5'-phosphate oxidase family protein [Acidimicrobiales bacterium]